MNNSNGGRRMAEGAGACAKKKKKESIISQMARGGKIKRRLEYCPHRRFQKIIIHLIIKQFLLNPQVI